MADNDGLKMNELRPAAGARKARRRVGRGDGSGRGTFSGRGLKGQKSRSGGGVRVGFQGGQLRLIKSLPMLRGFTPRSQTRYQEVNLDRLSRLAEGQEATPETMAQAGIIDSAERPVKVLGRGEVSGPVTVAAHRFSASARRKIEAAGGTVRQVD